MADDPDVNDVAGVLRVAIGLLLRRMRQGQGAGELTLPKSSPLPRLDRGGPTTSSALAKLEQISPQSMGATLGGLEDRGLLDRRSDPADGRRVVLSLTAAGMQALQNRRDAGNKALAEALAAGFTPAEISQLEAVAPLIERLAQ